MLLSSSRTFQDVLGLSGVSIHLGFRLVAFGLTNLAVHWFLNFKKGRFKFCRHCCMTVMQIYLSSLSPGLC